MQVPPSVIQPLGYGTLGPLSSGSSFDPVPQSSTALLPSLMDGCESEDTTTSNDSANIYHYEGIGVKKKAELSPQPLRSRNQRIQPSIGNGAFRRYSGGASKKAAVVKPVNTVVNPVVWSLPQHYHSKRTAVPSAPIPSPMYVHGDHGTGTTTVEPRTPQRPSSPVPFAAYGDFQSQQQQQRRQQMDGGESYEMYDQPCRYVAPSLLDSDSTTTATSVSSLSSGSARRMTSTIQEQMARYMASKKLEEEEQNRKRAEAASKLGALPELTRDGDDDDDDDESDAKSSVDQLAHFLTAPAAALNNPAKLSDPPPSLEQENRPTTTSPLAARRRSVPDGEGTKLSTEREKQIQSLMQLVADSYDEDDGVIRFEDDEEDDDGEEIWEFDQYDGRHLEEEEQMFDALQHGFVDEEEAPPSVPLNTEVRELLKDYLDSQSSSVDNDEHPMEQQTLSTVEGEVTAPVDEGMSYERRGKRFTESGSDADGEYEDDDDDDQSASALSLTVDDCELEGDLQPSPNSGSTRVLASMVSIDDSALSAPTDEDMSEPSTPDMSFLARDVVEENTQDDHQQVTQRKSISERSVLGGPQDIDIDAAVPGNLDGNYLSHLMDGIGTSAMGGKKCHEEDEEEAQPSDMVSLEWSMSDITTSIASMAPSRDTFAASVHLADGGEAKEERSLQEQNGAMSPVRSDLNRSRGSEDDLHTQHATSLRTFAYRDFPRARRRRLSAGQRHSRRDGGTDHLGSLTNIPGDEDEDETEGRRLEPIVELEEDKKVLKVRWVPSLIRLYQYKLTRESSGNSSISSKSFAGSAASGVSTPPESTRRPQPEDSEQQLVNALYRSIEVSGEAGTPISSLDGSGNAKQTKRKTLSPRSVLDPTVGVVSQDECNRELHKLPSTNLNSESNLPTEQTSPLRHHGDGTEPYLDDFVEAPLKVSLFDCKLPGAGELCLLHNRFFGDDISAPGALVRRALEESLREDDQEPNRRNRVRRIRDSIRKRSAIRQEAGVESQHWPSVDTDYSMDALFESYSSARRCILDDKPLEAVSIFEKLLRNCEDCDQEVHDDAFVYKLVGAVMHNIAVIHMRSDTFDKCVDLWDETILTLRDANPSEGVYTSHVATALTELGISHFASKRYHKAIKAFADVLHIWQEIRGVENDSITTAVNNIGVTYFALGAPFEALDAFDEALEVHRGILTGKDQQGSPLFSERVNVSNGLRSKGVKTSSDGSVLSLGGSAMEAGKTLVGVAKTLCNIAYVYRHLGEDEDALGLLEEALQIQEAVRGSEDLHTETTRMMMEAIRTSLSTEGHALDRSVATESNLSEPFDKELMDMHGASKQQEASFRTQDSLRKLHYDGVEAHGRKSPASPSRISEFSRRLSESLAPTAYSSSDTAETIRRRALMSMFLSAKGDQ